MDHLIKIVKEKANLKDEQAKAATEAFLTEFKLKFPKLLHTEIDKVAEGGDFGDSAREKFDHIRDKMEEAAKLAGEKAEGFAVEIKKKFSEMFGDGKKN
ncbi:MAG TPA: hypothetical protein PKM97_08565 [Bacteroidia bacterium]|nr:hypothetical protein [Bacteroidia bacterium]